MGLTLKLVYLVVGFLKRLTRLALLQMSGTLNQAGT